MNMRTPLQTRILILLVVALACAAAGDATAQSVVLRLDDVRSATAAQDPMASQDAWNDAASLLRQRNLQTGRLPQFFLSGQATWQNEVPEVGLPGMALNGPPLEQARAQVEMEWSVFDGGYARRQRQVETARLGEQQAGVQVGLNQLMDAASETFYVVLLQDARISAMEAAEKALGDRHSFLRVRAQEGAATAADAAILEAEWIRVGQDAAQARALRRAALDVLESFTGRTLPDNLALEVPDLSLDMTEADPSAVNGSPVVTELQRRVDRAAAESAAVSVMAMPRVSLFGQTGWGRPGPFNFLSDDINDFAMVGVRMRWTVFDWGQVRRTREAAEVQSRIVDSYRQSTAQRIRRDVADDLALEAHLSARAADDERIVALRATVLEATERQLEEGALIGAAYTERLAEWTAARADRDVHRIERSRAQFRILSVLGLLAASDSSIPSTDQP